MDETHSLLLNEEAFQACPEPKRAVFIYEWLRYLDRVLPVTQRGDIKDIQKELLRQLESRLNTVTGPPTRILLARCITRVHLLGDVTSLFGTINSCNDTLRAKDESTASTQAKLAALACLASLYEHAGRMVGRTYEDTFQILQKWMKSAESQSRAQIMVTLSCVVKGLGNGGSSIHKDIYKLSKSTIGDRSVAVRVATIECLTALVPLYTPIYTIELEAACTVCIKAFDGASYELRCAVARFMALLIATAIKPPAGAFLNGKSNQSIPVKPASIPDCLQLLAAGFLRGGIGGFLKGNSGGAATVGGAKDVRIGVSLAYVEAVREMGSTWLERNLAVICHHFVELAAKCGHLAFTQNAAQMSEALVLRKCVSYMLRATIGQMLGENAQLIACKHLGALLSQQINSIDISIDPNSETVYGSDSYASGYAAVVMLKELSSLVRQIGTAVMPIFVEASGIMEPVFACLLHPIAVTRMATAWCLRCVSIAVPSLLAPLMDRCISRLEHMKSSPDAISGYSMALAALIAASGDSKLGIPYSKPLQILALADGLITTSLNQASTTAAKIEAGWNILDALVSIGTPVVKNEIARIIKLFKAAFPRSAKEADAQKVRGDAFTWNCTMIAQAGALSVMEGLASHPELSQLPHVTESMSVPIECSLVMMSHVGTLIRTYGNKMRQLNSLLRVRVYRLLLALPHKRFEGSFVALLRELVADVTLSDNAQSTLTTSLPAQCASGVETPLLPTSSGTTDHGMIEDLMQSPSIEAGFMEEDVSLITRTSAARIGDLWPDRNSMQLECLDLAISVYGKVFPLIASKHKVQIIEHFADVVKNCKNAARQQSIHLNAITATMLAYKCLCEQRGPKVENENLQKASVALIVPALSNSCSVTRFAAAEALSRLAQAVGSPQFVASMAQYCFDKLKAGRDVFNRAGHVLALGCLHRHVGSLGSGQHLNTSVSIVLALAQDTNIPNVQACALVAMALIAETGGGMFRGFVETALSVCLKLLLSTPTANVEVVQGVGKLLTALITCVGPELGCAGVIDGVRASLLAACALQLSHSDPLVKAEAISGLQQMHLFAPRYVHLNILVVDICSLLSSSHLIIRRAAVCCLRQLVQREAKEVHDAAQVLVPQGVVDESRKLPLPDTGLEGALLAMLDVEIQEVMRAHIEETLISLVQGTCGELLNNWLLLCKDILATSTDQTTRMKDGASEKRERKQVPEGGADSDVDDEHDDMDDDVTLAGAQIVVTDKGKVQPRWPTKVFVMQIVQRLMNVCETERAHLDLVLAKELQMTSAGRSDYLVLHLSDLVRMSFMAATSDNSQLRMAGLNTLEQVIQRFSSVPEPEFPGHVILEQFQAQVGAALRPAFTDDTPSNVTSVACQVCSTWIGSGVARDLNDLRRVHQLLVSSLRKLKHESLNAQLYSESAATLEKLSILKAWAEVYVTAVRQEERENTIENSSRSREDQNGYRDDDICENGGIDSYRQRSHQELYEHRSLPDSLLSLVEGEIDSIVGFWLASLRDAALLSLPAHYAEQYENEADGGKGGTFFTAHSADACREYYRSCWPPILLATTIWLKRRNFLLPSTLRSGEDVNAKSTNSVWKDDGNVSRFHLLIGISIEALSSKTRNLEDHVIQMTVNAMTSLMTTEWCQLYVMTQVDVAIEMLNVLHRLILTRDCLTTQLACIECSSAILDAARVSIQLCSSRDIENGNVMSEEESEGGQAKLYGFIPTELFSGNEGGEEGTIIYSDAAHHGADQKANHRIGTISYATLELCLCTIIRQMPQINNTQLKARLLSTPLHLKRLARLPPQSVQLVVRSIQLLIQVPKLCSTEASLSVLPIIMYLLIGFIRESARFDDSILTPSGTIGQTARISHDQTTAGWTEGGGDCSAQLTVAQVSLQALRALLSSPPSSENGVVSGDVRNEWDSIMQSTFYSLLLLADDVNVYDGCVLMLAAVVLVTSAPANIIVSHRDSLQRFIALLTRNLHSSRPTVVIKTLHAITSIFGRRDFGGLFVRHLALPLIGVTRPYVDAGGNDDDEKLNQVDITIVSEAIKGIEKLTLIASDEKRIRLVSLLVQTLVRLLKASSQEEWRQLGVMEKMMHEMAIERLNAAASMWQADFKKVVGHSEPLKKRLEGALLLQSMRHTQSMKNSNRNRQKQQETRRLHEPKIKLTMFGSVPPSSN